MIAAENVCSTVCPQCHYRVLHLYRCAFECSALIVNQCLVEMKEMELLKMNKCSWRRFLKDIVNSVAMRILDIMSA